MSFQRFVIIQVHNHNSIPLSFPKYSLGMKLHEDHMDIWEWQTGFPASASSACTVAATQDSVLRNSGGREAVSAMGTAVGSGSPDAIDLSH